MKLPPGGFQSGDMFAYRWLVQQLPIGGRMVELGSYRGRSICSIASVLLERSIDVTLVDLFYGLPPNPKQTEVLSGIHYEDSSELRTSLEKNVTEFGLTPRIIESDSADAAKLFDDNSVDLVFVDADHQFDGVLRDLNAWWPKVHATGRISGHDYTAELDRPRGARNYGSSGGYSVAPALRRFFMMTREVKRVPRQSQSTVWYVNKDPTEDLVLRVVSTSDLERSLRTHLKPEGEVGLRVRRLILEIIASLGYPTREHAIYACAGDKRIGCHLTSTAWYISRLLRSHHLKLVPRREVM